MATRTAAGIVKRMVCDVCGGFVGHLRGDGDGWQFKQVVRAPRSPVVPTFVETDGHQTPRRPRVIVHDVPVRVRCAQGHRLRELTADDVTRLVSGLSETLRWPAA